MRLTSIVFGKKKFWIFASWVKACVHICDHLLTAPEAREWVPLIPSLKDILGNRGCFELAKRLWTGSDDAGSQTIYDAYARQIRLCLASAEGEGWHGEDFTRDGCQWSLGVNGVVAVLSPKNVLTAYIPGAGNPDALPPDESTEGSEEAVVAERRRNPLPRQSCGNESSEEEGVVLPDADRVMQNFKNSVFAVRNKAFLWYQEEGFAVPATFEEWRPKFAYYSSAIGDTHGK